MTRPAEEKVIDFAASLKSLARCEHVQGGMLKLPADLDRYARVIAGDRPEVVVETGTRTGASAAWFASQGCDVVSVDVVPPPLLSRPGILFVVGDSVSPAVVSRVRDVVAGRRCMVSLDSDHSAAHVAAEIRLYGPLVSPGCHLVVEDGIFGHASEGLRAQHGLAGMVGSPLDAIEECLAGDPGWSRDLEVEALHPATHHIAGWWRRSE